jgi:hypothetical protein
MNRRDFVKIGALGIFSAPLLASANTNTNLLFNNSPQFLSVFEKLDFTDGKEPILPNFCTSYGSWNEIVFRKPNQKKYNNPKTLFVPPYELTGDSVDEINNQSYKDAAQVLLCASADRNIVVYDSTSTKTEITPRLYQLMKIQMRRNSGGTSSSIIVNKPVTDIFCRKSKIPKFANLSINWHGIDKSVWDYLEEFYLRSLGGKFPGKKNNLLIAVSTDRSIGGFVHAIISNNKRNLLGKYTQVCGLAVTDNTRVMLGAF